LVTIITLKKRVSWLEKQPLLSPTFEEILRMLGENIYLARLRRKISTTRLRAFFKIKK